MAAQTLPTVRSILFLGTGQENASPRQFLAAEALAALGCQVTEATQLPENSFEQYDAVIAHHPHGVPGLVKRLAACVAAGMPVILDLETDFESLPLNDPRYSALGLGTPASARAYTTSLLLADAITVPVAALAEQLRLDGYQVHVIPDGWSRANPLWEKPSPRRSTLNLGWIGQPGQVEDVAPIRRMIARLMREFAHLRLVIAGDPQVVHLFESLPESRCLFLPPASPEDYPHLLAQVDILIAPLRNTPYNHYKSDRPLVEAGVRGIPWVASPVPAFQAWQAGGMLAASLDEWHSQLRCLVEDTALRLNLGRAGRQKAEQREISYLGPLWLKLLNETMQIVRKVPAA